MFHTAIETLPLKKGEVAFTRFNRYLTSALRMPTVTFVMDPADVDSTILKNVDAILVTHEHLNQDVHVVQKIHRRTQCVIAADSSSAERLRDTIESNKLNKMRVVKEIGFDNITIRVGAFKHPSTALAFCRITSEEEAKRYHASDSLPYRNIRQISESSPPNIVFGVLHAPAPGTSPQSGLEIAEMVKMAVPHHAPTADCKGFAEFITKEAPDVECMIMKHNKSMYP